MSGENRVKLSERIYERAKALWPRYLTHPFVTEMADGPLPKEKFRCILCVLISITLLPKPTPLMVK